MTVRTLPPRFADWFAARGWAPRRHQLELLDIAKENQHVLLIAPTGGGKTLGGFLPSLIDLHHTIDADRPSRSHRLHTLYVSPLKALAQDVARNLTGPAEEMGLGLRIETRTGDTPASKRQRQRTHPPDILLTTPEQIALLCASEYAPALFADLQAVIIDELHAIAPTKRGALLSLGLAALGRWAPGYRRVGLSATVEDPPSLAAWLGGDAPAAIVQGAPGAEPVVDVLVSKERIPWSGHTGRHQMREIYGAIQAAKQTLVFVNTRSQAEMTFQALWAINTDNLAIALHHGSLSAEQRRKVESAMTQGALRAVVATSTLDLGVDWGDVDLVIQMGAPKGASRLVQRIGRANHRMDEPSRAVLAPSNRFEVLECRAAQDAVRAGQLDGEALRPGGLDVLAQHVMGRACGAPFLEDELYAEIRAAWPYRDLDRATFDRVVSFVATGGYALAAYDRHKRIVKDKSGRWRARNAQIAQRHRMNVGAIVEAPHLDVRLVRPGGAARTGRKLGQVEEWFVEQLVQGDTFMFAGQVLRFEGLAETDVLVSRSPDAEPKIPSWQGGKFPLSTFLADRVRQLAHDPSQWDGLPEQVVEWLSLQQVRSAIPPADELLVETFPRGRKHYLVAYPFDGRLAHQTLGMLLTRRLERLRKAPLGFVASEYAVSVWGLKDMGDVDMDALFDQDMLGDDLEAWLDESPLMKRTFRNCAVIAGLIERRFPGQEKTGRQVTFSTDLIYDVLRKHEPDHLLLQAARADAGAGLLDVARLGQALARVKGRVRHQALTRVSPFAVPVMLEIGREPVYGEASEALMEEAAEDLIAEAMRP
ncbi:MAG: ligase-associated DNA damage response DEXH box helicase [Maricaulaceae bacterium]